MDKQNKRESLLCDDIARLVMVGPKIGEKVSFRIADNSNVKGMGFDAHLDMGKKIHIAIMMKERLRSKNIKRIASEILGNGIENKKTYFLIHFSDGAIFVDGYELESISKGEKYDIVELDKLFEELELRFSKVPTSDLKREEAKEFLASSMEKFKGLFKKSIEAYKENIEIGNWDRGSEGQVP